MLVAVELQDIELTSTRDERVRCRVRVLVTVSSKAVKPAGPPQPKLYEYVGSFSSLAVWLDADSDFVETSFAGASQQIASQIVADLAAK